MANPRKKNDEPASAPAGEPAPSEPKFEQALSRLEQIVAEMESAELPLDEVVKRYEEGIRLARLCSRKLEEAEKRIEILARKEGAVAAEPFEPASPEPPPAPAAARRAKSREESEGSLF